jgi:hypothetical protein
MASLGRPKFRSALPLFISAPAKSFSNSTLIAINGFFVVTPEAQLQITKRLNLNQTPINPDGFIIAINGFTMTTQIRKRIALVHQRTIAKSFSNSTRPSPQPQPSAF